MDARKMISKAIVSLVTDGGKCFFGRSAMRLQVVESSPGEGVPTAAVDGRRLFYNPEFVKGLSGPELVGLMAHEVMHVALCHMTRRGKRDPRLWNIAADFVINVTLRDDGMTLPAGALYDPKFRGMSTEAVYDALSKTLPEDKITALSAKAGESCGEVRDAPEVETGAGEVEALEREVKETAIQAANATKGRGNLPGWAKALVEDIRAPKVDWRARLWRFVDSTNKSDYSWSPPNRRHVHSGLYLPSMRSDSIAEIAFVVDTSGSINSEAFEMMAGEIEAAAETVRPDAIRMIQCDTRVHMDTRIAPGDALPREIIGRGGTDMSPAFDLVRRDGASVLICLTDMRMDEPADPGCPVLWASYREGGLSPSYGERIDIRT